MFRRVEIPGRPGGARAHGTVLVHLYRPSAARSGISYRLTTDGGDYDRTLGEDSALDGPAADYLTLEFTDVPMASPLSVEQVSGGRILMVNRALPKRVLGKVVLSDGITKTAFNTEPSTRFLRNAMNGVLA